MVSYSTHTMAGTVTDKYIFLILGYIIFSDQLRTPLHRSKSISIQVRCWLYAIRKYPLVTSREGFDTTHIYFISTLILWEEMNKNTIELLPGNTVIMIFMVWYDLSRTVAVLWNETSANESSRDLYEYDTIFFRVSTWEDVLRRLSRWLCSRL